MPHGLIDNLPPKKSGMITNATYLMNVFLELDPARKRELQEHLTALLPDWFGQPQSNAKYAAQAERRAKAFVAACFCSNGQRCKRRSLLDGGRSGIPSFRCRPGFNNGRNRCCLRTVG